LAGAKQGGTNRGRSLKNVGASMGEIIGTGVDVIEISRIRRAVERWGEDFLRHIFTDRERRRLLTYKRPYPHYAVRFAAKEAVYKALPCQEEVGWKDLEILNDDQGRPYVLCHRKDFSGRIFISLSHSRDYAVASAIITEG